MGFYLNIETETRIKAFAEGQSWACLCSYMTEMISQNHWGCDAFNICKTWFQAGVCFPVPFSHVEKGGCYNSASKCLVSWEGILDLEDWLAALTFVMPWDRGRRACLCQIMITRGKSCLSFERSFGAAPCFQQDHAWACSAENRNRHEAFLPVWPIFVNKSWCDKPH